MSITKRELLEQLENLADADEVLLVHVTDEQPDGTRHPAVIYLSHAVVEPGATYAYLYTEDAADLILDR